MVTTNTYGYSALKVNNITPSAVKVNNTNCYRLKVNNTDVIHKYHYYTLSGTIKLSIRYTFERTSRTEPGDKCTPSRSYYTMHLKKIEMCINSTTGDIGSMTVKLTNYSQSITQDYGAGGTSLTTLSFTASTQLSSTYTTVGSGDTATREGNADFTTSITLLAPVISLNHYWSASDGCTINFISSINVSISAVSATSSSTSANTESSAHSYTFQSSSVKDY